MLWWCAKWIRQLTALIMKRRLLTVEKPQHLYGTERFSEPLLKLPLKPAESVQSLVRK